MKVYTTAEKVLEAAKNCSVSDNTLRTLFPDVFKNDMHLARGGIYKLSGGSTYILTAIGGNYFLVNLKTGAIKTSASSTMKGAFSYDYEDAVYLGDGSTLRTMKDDMICRL